MHDGPTKTEVEEAIEVMLDNYSYSEIKHSLDSIHRERRIKGFMEEGMSRIEASQYWEDINA